METLFVLFLGTGLILAVLSIPMILGKVPPNGLYGFRVRRTLENPDLWYPVNRRAGLWLFFTAVCVEFATVGLALVPGIPLEVYSLSVAAVLAVVFTGAMTAIYRYMNSL